MRGEINGVQIGARFPGMHIDFDIGSRTGEIDKAMAIIVMDDFCNFMIGSLNPGYIGACRDCGYFILLMLIFF